MDNVSCVEVLQTHQCLPQDVLAYILRVNIAHLGDNRRESVVHDLQEDPQAALVLILVEDFEDEVVACAHVHQRYLVHHELLLTLVLQVLDELESDHFLIRFALHFEHLSESTRSKLVLRCDIIVSRRVRLFEACILGQIHLEALSRWHATGRAARISRL